MLSFAKGASCTRVNTVETRTDAEQPPDGADAVHRHDADWVIDLEAVEQRVGDHGDDRTDDPDHDRLPRATQRADGCKNGGNGQMSLQPDTGVWSPPVSISG